MTRLMVSPVVSSPNWTGAPSWGGVLWPTAWRYSCGLPSGGAGAHPQVRDLHPQDRPDRDPGHQCLPVRSEWRNTVLAPLCDYSWGRGPVPWLWSQWSLGSLPKMWRPLSRWGGACLSEGTAVPPRAHVPVCRWWLPWRATSTIRRTPQRSGTWSKSSPCPEGEDETRPSVTGRLSSRSSNHCERDLVYVGELDHARRLRGNPFRRPDFNCHRGDSRGPCWGLRVDYRNAASWGGYGGGQCWQPH